MSSAGHGSWTKPLKVGALFAGYGGLEMGVSQVLDAEPAWLAEFEPAPSRILAQRFPGVPNLGDVTKIKWTPDCPECAEPLALYWVGEDAHRAYWCREHGEFPLSFRLTQMAALGVDIAEPVEILTGGSPCQDLSHAGKRAGMRAGTRSGLWASMCDAIETIRPRLVLWENVRGALSACASSESDRDLGPCPRCVDPDPRSKLAHAPNLRAIGRVLGDLSELGYDAAWHVIRASDVGAPHQRERVFVLAWPADDTSVIRPAAGTGWMGGGSPVLTLLKTPTSQLAVNGGSQHPDKRRQGGHGPTLADEVEHLLPTPAVNDMGASYDVERWDAWTARMKAEHGNGNGHGKSLSIEALRMLPTPQAMDTAGAMPDRRSTSGYGPALRDVATLLPTPTSTDHKASGASYAATDTHHTGTTLTDAVVRGHGLMPTPSVADVEGGRKHRSGARSGELLLNGLAHAQAFGQYAPAIARWESVLGRPAPAPTEPTGKGGAHRLSPRFVEWLMGLPDGWVTGESVEAWRVRLADRRAGLDARPVGHRGSVARRRAVATRNEQLKALGNGVVPQQAAAAVRHLLGVREWALSA